jgi:predicted RNA-binding Zn ribbon-like protein
MRLRNGRRDPPGQLGSVLLFRCSSPRSRNRGNPPRILIAAFGPIAPVYAVLQVQDYTRRVHRSMAKYRCYSVLVATRLKPPAPRADLPFKYLGGDASLDLVNTVDWTVRGLANERLTSYERLTQWAEGAGMVPTLDAERLRAAARVRPRTARTVFERARRLRAALQRLYAGQATGTLHASVGEDFNTELAEALHQLRVGLRQGNRKGVLRVGWTWGAPRERLDSFLWPVVWSAAKLLTSEEADRIRVCAGTDCGWMYVDRSRNGLRRWCAMETCGTAEKTRRRRERHGRRVRSLG